MATLEVQDDALATVSSKEVGLAAEARLPVDRLRFTHDGKREGSWMLINVLTAWEVE